MEKLKNKIEETGAHLVEYYETHSELKKLQVLRKSAEAFSASAAGILVAFIFFFVVIFASVAGAFAFSEWIGKSYAGFLIISGFYLLLGILLLAFRDRWIKTPLMNSMIKNFFNHE